LRSDRYIPPP